ncbi:zinc finger protein [Macleaya cordata]|uniref:Zinc finger protein n=1 Tax=Macleaya cordata TaxID=56857 RepID=A0A200PTT5_MACCD|nr:zinc finger protein [Macleaya cordata]
METGGVDRRKARLTSQISVHSKKRNNDGLDSLVGLTVDAVLGNSQELNKPVKQNQQPTTRTLLDIISDEESGAAYRGLAANSIKNKKKSKKSIKDRLKFRSSWSCSSSCPVPTSDFPLNNRRIQQISNPVLVDHPLSTSCSIKRTTDDHIGKSDLSTETTADDCGKSDLTKTLKKETTTDEERKSDSSDDDDDVERESVDVGATEPVITPPAQENELKSAAQTESESEEEVEGDRNASGPLISEPTTDNEDEEEEEENESGPLISESMVEAPMISLMALLEESGRRAEDDEEEEDEVDEEDEEGGGGGVEYVCTVCMVKHRGLAFVPCGHTFCRLCSKELWVSKGNCPLCTGYILEILDIF